MKTKIQKILPPGKSGNAEIQHFNVSQQQASLHFMYSTLRGQANMYVPPGNYVRLLIDGKLVMSDTPAELAMTKEFVDKAHGHVLVTGLGLGLVVLDLFNKPEVESVTVIEKNVHVIRLTYPRINKFLSKRYEFIVSHKDAFEWKPCDMITIPKDMRWNCILHDIWSDINDLNLPDMFKLKRRYAHWLDKSDPDRFQFAWSEKEAHWMRSMINKARSVKRRVRLKAGV